MFTIGTSQRILIWAGMVSILLFSVAFCFFMDFFPPPAPRDGRDEIMEVYTDHNTLFRVGVVLCLLTGTGVLLPISIVIAAQMRRIEEGFPIWTIVQLLTATIGTIFLWGPPLIWGAAAFTTERDPDLTVLLHEVGWLMFITPLTAFPAQLLSIAFVAFKSLERGGVPAFPRWIGYLTVWQAVQSLGGVLAMCFDDGPLAWNGVVPFYIPVGMFFVWAVAISYTMLRAIRDQEQQQATV